MTNSRMLKPDIYLEAQEFIDGLDKKRAAQLANAIDRLCANPHPGKCRKLKGLGGYFRVRAGDYRIIYEVDGESLNVVLVDTRHDDEVYRALERKLN